MREEEKKDNLINKKRKQICTNLAKVFQTKEVKNKGLCIEKEKKTEKGKK